MKTIAVAEFPEVYSEMLAWIESGQEVTFSRHGKVIARLVPQASTDPSLTPQPMPETKVDWTTSAAFTRDRTGERVLTAEEVASVLEENRGNW